MPAPKPFTVVLILAVFACVALYVLGVGLGATDNSQPGSSSSSKQERQRLRERFIHPSPVKPEDLKASCPLTSGVLSIVSGLTCRVTIGEGGRARTLEVSPAGPGSGTVAMQFTPKTQPALPLSENPLREAKKLDVMDKGAELSLTCLSAGTGGRCLVQLK